MFENGIYGYRLSYIIIRPGILLKETYRHAKWFVQRGKRGWADCDVWSIDGYLSSILPDMLQRLRDTTHGYPIDMTEGEWDRILQEMILGFKAHQSLAQLDFFDDVSNRIDNAKLDCLEKQKEHGMKLFVKHFNDLWD